MKSFINRFAVALLIASLASVAAFAKTRSEKVTFTEDIKVNGTLISKGTYEVKFDDQTGEVSIVKSGKVIARANTTSEKRGSKARDFEWKAKNAELTAVTFAGTDQNIVLNSAAASN